VSSGLVSVVRGGYPCRRNNSETDKFMQSATTQIFGFIILAAVILAAGFGAF